MSYFPFKFNWIFFSLFLFLKICMVWSSLECVPWKWETRDAHWNGKSSTFPMKWRDRISSFLTLFSFFSTSLCYFVFLNYKPFLLNYWCYLFLQALCFISQCSTAQKVYWYLGGWRLWTAFSNILLVLGLLFLKSSPACLNTLWLLCLMALVSLKLDVSHTSDPLRFSLISSFPVSFFGEDRSNSYRMLSSMWPIFSWVKAVDCTAAIP